MNKLYALLVIIICILMSGPVYAAHAINFRKGDIWHYFKGVKSPSEKWKHVGFDDSEWELGPSGFGYGKSDNNTLLKNMRGNYKSIYVRREFRVKNTHRITRLTLSLYCDGPFVAYLDGIEVLRSKKRQKGEILDLSGFAHEINHDGKNVVAIKCSNDDINSDDFSFIPVFYLSEE